MTFRVVTLHLTYFCAVRHFAARGGVMMITAPRICIVKLRLPLALDLVDSSACPARSAGLSAIQPMGTKRCPCETPF
jgi:hypothetical protein